MTHDNESWITYTTLPAIIFEIFVHDSCEHCESCEFCETCDFCEFCVFIDSCETGSSVMWSLSLSFSFGGWMISTAGDIITADIFDRNYPKLPVFFKIYWFSDKITLNESGVDGIFTKDPVNAYWLFGNNKPKTFIPIIIKWISTRVYTIQHLWPI